MTHISSGFHFACADVPHPSRSPKGSHLLTIHYHPVSTASPKRLLPNKPLCSSTVFSSSVIPQLGVRCDYAVLDLSCMELVCHCSLSVCLFLLFRLSLYTCVVELASGRTLRRRNDNLSYNGGLRRCQGCVARLNFRYSHGGDTRTELVIPP